MRRVVVGAGLAATLVVALLAGGCATSSDPGAAPAVVVPVETLNTMRAECSALWSDELGRQIDDVALEDCVHQRIADGRTIEDFRTLIRASDEYRALIERITAEANAAAVGRIARLRVDGRRMVRTDGRPFTWRFATGFQALDYVADGNEGAAVAFLEWARSRGFNGVRVLSTLCCWFDLAPEDGLRALPRLLALAGERGLYVEVVALAGTRERWLEADAIRTHVARVGGVCGEVANCVIELANENAHDSQRADLLTSAAFLRELRAMVPYEVPVSVGSNCCGQSDEVEVYAGGDYITVHTDRSRDKWNRTRHVRELELVAGESGKFVVDDEPIGAGESDEGGRRSADPAEFFARGVLSRIFGFGATFHFSDGLPARPPGPVQDAAARAFVEGASIVADDVLLTFKNAGWSDSPVKAFRFDEGGAPNSALRAFSGLGAVNILALVGVNGDPGVEFQNGWRAGRVLADRPGIRVVELIR